MNRCKNCEYFNRNKDDKFNNIKYGSCNCEKFQYDIASKYEKETDKLFYMDYEGYNAGIEVGEDFGCIHFKKIENKERNE